MHAKRRVNFVVYDLDFAVGTLCKRLANQSAAGSLPAAEQIGSTLET
jgi:hypothetical protein